MAARQEQRVEWPEEATAVERGEVAWGAEVPAVVREEAVKAAVDPAAVEKVMGCWVAGQRAVVGSVVVAEGGGAGEAVGLAVEVPAVDETVAVAEVEENRVEEDEAAVERAGVVLVAVAKAVEGAASVGTAEATEAVAGKNWVPRVVVERERVSREAAVATQGAAAGTVAEAAVGTLAAVVCWWGGCVRTCTVGRACRSTRARDWYLPVLAPLRRTRHIGIHCTCTRWPQSTPSRPLYHRRVAHLRSPRGRRSTRRRTRPSRLRLLGMSPLRWWIQRRRLPGAVR